MPISRSFGCDHWVSRRMAFAYSSNQVAHINSNAACGRLGVYHAADTSAALMFCGLRSRISVSCFTERADQECLHWLSHPTYDDAHSALRSCLAEIIGGVFLAETVSINDRQRGNLGEFIAFYIGNYCAGFEGYQAFAANALKPLDNISRPDLDLVWALFDEHPDKDNLILQEVKTTLADDLVIAYKLNDDYRKLFGRDPQLTLKARLSSIKSELEFQHRRPDLARRLNRFVASTPARCTDVRLLPTVVFDPRIATSPLATNRLLMVRRTLIGEGWPEETILPWAVPVEELDDRLHQLARGN
jgi:hypothetical protein